MLEFEFSYILMEFLMISLLRKYNINNHFINILLHGLEYSWTFAIF